jgi:TonB family protein
MPKVISAPDPVYPQALRQQRLQPTVHFIIRIDENGAVTDIVALAEPALAGAFTSGFVLRKWKFQPARVADKPVPAIVTVEINFRLY